jgi:hypothetical protein
MDFGRDGAGNACISGSAAGFNGTFLGAGMDERGIRSCSLPMMDGATIVGRCSFAPRGGIAVAADAVD